MKKIIILLAIVASLLAANVLLGQVNIEVNVTGESRQVSPYLYGKNNSTSSKPDEPTSEETWTQIRESGATLLRENSGNECTKYHYKRKLGSAPDWFNMVFHEDWDYEVQSIQERLPYIQSMWGFQLLGWAAKSTDHNWDAWSFYVDHGKKKWPPVSARQNLAGGGVPDSLNPDSEHALVEGDINLYLEEWPIDSSVNILNHWFGEEGIGVDKEKVRYWSMDNEPDIWSSTHDDVMKEQITAEEFLQRYFKAAKLARSIYPDIKIVGPVTANEWFWYDWPGGGTEVNGKKLPWLEYFIKRVGEEQKATGIRLLDVLAIHFYPGTSDTEELVQMHRIYFDENYSFPEANGVKLVNGGWDSDLNKEYIFKRCEDWMEEYIGPDHGVGLGITETGIKSDDPNTCAVWYASTLGEFIRHDVELFTPWSWKKGMWEVLHLYARYNQPLYIPTSSSDETMVSAYATANENKDSVNIMLVNRHTTQSKTTTIRLKGYAPDGENFTLLSLSDLPNKETFVSHSDNALSKQDVSAESNKVTVTLPPLSVSSLSMKMKQSSAITGLDNNKRLPDFKVFPNPSNGVVGVQSLNVKEQGDCTLNIRNTLGQIIYKSSLTGDKYKEIDLSGFGGGVLFITFSNNQTSLTKKLIVQ